MHCAYFIVIHSFLSFRSPAVLLSLAAVVLLPLHQGLVAADAPKESSAKPTDKAHEKPGDWLILPEDGTPWIHEGTGLRYPQVLGGFKLRLGFRDKDAKGGIAISYTHESKNIRGDVVLFPCDQELGKLKDVMVYLRGKHDALVKEMLKASKEQGYAELTHTPVEERAVNLWQGNLPLTVQNFEFGASLTADELVKPPTSQWLGVALYQDHFVQMSIVRPTISGKEGEGLRDELVKLFLQCIREPSVIPEMLKLCRTYVHDPLTKEGREAADALNEYAHASPVFRIVYPGEQLTPILDTANALDKEMALDLLRSYLVGAGVVALQGGTADQSIEEGVRIMAHVYGELKKTNDKLKSDTMEELLPLSAKGQAAGFLRKKMDASASQPPAK